MSVKRPEMRREMDIRVGMVRNMDFFFFKAGTSMNMTLWWASYVSWNLFKRLEKYSIYFKEISIYKIN